MTDHPRWENDVEYVRADVSAAAIAAAREEGRREGRKETVAAMACTTLLAHILTDGYMPEIHDRQVEDALNEQIAAIRALMEKGE